MEIMLRMSVMIILYSFLLFKLFFCCGKEKRDFSAGKTGSVDPVELGTFSMPKYTHNILCDGLDKNTISSIMSPAR
jgi:hypothetical protein